MKPLKIFLVFFMLFILIVVNGCASVNKEEAEAKALEFVNEKVKFFAKEEDSTINLPQYSIDSITSYQENKNWVVIIHVSSKVDNETKKNDLIIKLDKKGEVIEFNGKEVPKELR
jgi:hypothetical protein